MQSMGVTEFIHQLSLVRLFCHLFPLEANIIHYNSALKAFEGNSWEAALALLEDLPQRMLEANLVELKREVCWKFGETYVDQPISITWIIEHALGVKLTSSLLLVGRRICRFKFQTFTAWAALDCMNLLNHLWVSNRFCIKLQNTLSVNHKVEMLQNHKVPVLKVFKRTLQIKVSLIRSTFSFAFIDFLFGFVGGCGFLLEYHGCAFGCGLMVPYSATITQDDSERLGKACVGTSAWFLACGHGWWNEMAWSDNEVNMKSYRVHSFPADLTLHQTNHPEMQDNGWRSIWPFWAGLQGKWSEWHGGVD